MKIELSFAELHNPLFLNNTNWGQKLKPNMGTKGKLELAYDRVEKELLVKAGSRIAIIPVGNVSSMEPVSTEALPKETEQVMEITPKGKPGPKPKINAQVSGPHDHVFAGRGGGKTND